MRANNLRILWIQNAKISGYYFHMNTNIRRGFQICISVPIIAFFQNQAILSVYQEETLLYYY